MATGTGPGTEPGTGSGMFDHRPERRAALLAAARSVMAEKGLEATKVSDIVARAGVAQGTFYLYFPSKISAVFALAENMSQDVLRAVQRAVDGTPTHYDAVEAAIAAAFREMERYKDILGIIHSRIEIAEMREECERLDQPSLDYLMAFIRHSQEAGQISPAVNAEIAAQLVAGLIEHAGHACFVLNLQRPTEAYIAEVARFIRGALGILPPA
jgi:AcrR family transcriptional regulator